MFGSIVEHAYWTYLTMPAAAVSSAWMDLAGPLANLALFLLGAALRVAAFAFLTTVRLLPLGLPTTTDEAHRRGGRRADQKLPDFATSRLMPPLFCIRVSASVRPSGDTSNTQPMTASVPWSTAGNSGT